MIDPALGVCRETNRLQNPILRRSVDVDHRSGTFPPPLSRSHVHRRATDDRRLDQAGAGVPHHGVDAPQETDEHGSGKMRHRFHCGQTRSFRDLTSNRLASRIVIRIQNQSASMFDRGIQNRRGKSELLIETNSGSMVKDNGPGTSQIPIEPFFEGRERFEIVDRGRPDDMDHRRIKSHPNESFSTGLGRWKVKIRELTDRMSHRLVRDSLRPISTVKMSEWYPRNGGRGCRGEGLYPIPQNHQEIGTNPGEGIRTSGNASAQGH